jgi:hypothetical protein
MFIAVDLAERGGINQIDVSPHNFGKSVFGICLGKSREQFGIGCHCFHFIAPAKIKSAQEKCV